MVIRHNVDNLVKPRRKVLKIVILSIVAILLAVGIWVGVTAYKTISKVTSLSNGNGNLFSLLKNNNVTLKGQTDGRTNILLLGYGGSGHSGGTLSDTIQVLSIDWKTNQLAMISVPRDLEVNVPGHGYSKINAAYSSGGGQLSSQTVSQVLGIPIHYFISLDFNGFVDIVNTVGGVDIDVENTFTDYSYPKSECNNATGIGCSLVTVHFDAGLQHMDGARALIFARSRHSLNNGEGTDFARSRRQQLLMLAIKKKVLTLDILANPSKITSLLNTVGSHLKTSLSVTEIKSLSSEMQKADTSNMVTKVFDTSAGNVLTSESNTLGDVLIPKKGLGNYSDLQTIAKNIFTANAANPDPTIQVLNGSGKTGQGTIEVNTLKAEGYTSVTTVSATKTAKTSVYNCSGTISQAVADKIAKELNTSVKDKTSCGNVDIQVLIGQDVLAN